MSTHTIDPAPRQDAQRPMNGALFRMVGVAVLSVVFALIHCTAPLDQGQGLTLPETTIDVPAMAVAAPDASDHHPGIEAHAHPN